MNRDIAITPGSVESKHLTKEDLKVLLYTGRDVVTGYGREKQHHYRSGVMTKLGDLTEENWMALVKELIARNKEQDIYYLLISGCKKKCAWIQTQAAAEKYALSIYCDGNYDYYLEDFRK